MDSSCALLGTEAMKPEATGQTGFALMSYSSVSQFLVAKGSISSLRQRSCDILTLSAGRAIHPKSN